MGLLTGLRDEGAQAAKSIKSQAAQSKDFDIG